MAQTKEQLRQRNFELGTKMDELNTKATLTAEETAQYAQMEREFKKNVLAMQSLAAESQIREQQAPKSANERLRETISAIRSKKMDNDFVLERDATTVITSGVMQSGEHTNMESAGLPLTIKDLINPLEMGTIYGQLGLQVATGVHGNIQWPCLDTAAEVSVGGELDDAGTKTLDFSKITAVPVKLGISIEVSNEAINDAAFDLEGVIKAQINKAVGRTINKRVLALSAPSAKPIFAGPLVSHKQSVSFTTAGAPTYAELKKMKGLVLGTGAQMAGFCYVMDAAMFSQLEATSKDAGSGRFIIEGGKIDGDPVFITDDTAYADKVAAGCFGYEALNQHGETHFIIDPFTQAKKNVTVFTLNGDWSLTYLVSSNSTKAAPFAVGA